MSKIYKGSRRRTLNIIGRKKINNGEHLNKVETYIKQINERDCNPALEDNDISLILKSLNNYSMKKGEKHE